MLTLDAPIVAQTRSNWLCLALGLGISLILAFGGALAQDGRISFDVSSQPLTKALHAFSAATGIEVLVDARHAANCHSPGVKGSMAPHEALEMLLVGSNLVAHEFGSGTVTLRTATVLAERTSGARDNQLYFADIQRAVQQLLCSDTRTSSGQYRLALKFWIGRSGAIIHPKRLDTTGDNGLDSVLDAAIQKVRIGRPPAPDFPQPITVIISPSQIHGTMDCSSEEQYLRRAANR